MGKRRRERGHEQLTDWSSERTLADAEAEAAEAERGAGELEIAALPLEPAERSAPGVEPEGAGASGARCACGSEEFLLEAYLAVVRGRPQPEPVELESLTCPQCGREYEAIWLDGGRVARGDYRGQTDLDE